MKINRNVQQLTNHVTSLSGGKTEQIERQIQSLQEEITKLDTDKVLDSKTKQEKKKQLEEELANLQQQLTQEKIKQRKNEKEEEKREAMPQTKQFEEKELCGMSNQEMGALLSASTTMKQAGAINRVREHMNGNAHVLKGEIAVIEARGGNPIEKKQELSDLQAKIDGVTGSMIAKYGEANKFMKAGVSGTEKVEEEVDADDIEKSGEKNGNEKYFDDGLSVQREKKEVNVQV